jgi:excisionase family DNA binding protein
MKRADQPKPPKFYTIEEIAECIGASTRTVRRWIEREKLS